MKIKNLSFINSLSILIILMLFMVPDKISGNQKKVRESAIPVKHHEVKQIKKSAVLLDSMKSPEVFKLPEPFVVKSEFASVSKIKNRKIKDFKPERLEFNTRDTKNIAYLDSFPPPDKFEAIFDNQKPLTSPELIRAKSPYISTINYNSFIFFSRSESFPNDDVSAMVEDSSGNIWISTYNGGIIRYDGSFFSHFTTKNGLIDNDILSLYVDDKNNLWFGSRYQGVTKFDGKTFTHFTVNEGLSSNSVEAIFQDNNGDMWFGTYGGGVNHFDGEYFTHYTMRQGLARNIVYGIEQDREGNMWFATPGGGLSMLDGNTIKTFTPDHGLVSDYFITSMTDKKGRLWFGSDGNGISVIDIKNNEIINFSPENGLYDGDILNLCESSDGSIWMGTRQKGILRYKENQLLNYSEDDGLINSYITYIIEDSSKQIWMGTFGSGIGLYKGDIFKHYGPDQGLEDSFIRAIEEDKNGNLWLGSFIQGIFVFDNQTFKKYNVESGLPDNRVRSLHMDHKDRMWIGTGGGWLAIYENGNFKNYDIGMITNYSSIVSITSDPENNIWLATHGGGLLKVEGEKIIRYRKENGLKENYIRKASYDTINHRLWIAYRSFGAGFLEGNHHHHIVLSEEHLNIDVRDIVTDKNGLTWIATNGLGLYLVEDNLKINFNIRNGLGSNFLYSLLVQGNNNILIGTRMGLGRILYYPQEGENGKRIENFEQGGMLLFKNYSRNEGYLGLGSNSRAIHLDSNNNVWIGANDLLTKYAISNDIPNERPPVVEVSEVNLFNEKINWNLLQNCSDTSFVLNNGIKIRNFCFDSISAWYGLPQQLKLDYSNNYLVFKFTGTCLQFREQVRYQYMLEGLEENWNSLTSENEAHYGNLPPGKYTFHLKAMNSDGKISESFTYPFSIRPPWWRSQAAFAGYGALLLVFFVIQREQNKQLQKAKEKRKSDELKMQQEVEIAKKSAEFKQSFLANMSHEIRTPLTGILGMTELLARTDMNNQQKDYLQTIMQSGENLREIINMVLDYSKIEAGKLQLKKSSFSVKEMILDAETYFQSICKKDIDFQSVIDKSIPEYIESDRQKLMQIIRNLISNAVKFTDKGLIEVKLSPAIPSSQQKELQKDEIQILAEVTDTGLGITRKQQKKLFKPFFQAEQAYDRTYEGTGLGLSICKELANMLEGDIGVNSMPGEGSTFWFTFKTRKSDPIEKKNVLGDHHKIPTSLKPLNILVAEDKVVNQKVIKLMLTSMNNNVTLAENGVKVLELFEKNVYDLILMDIQMPVMDGITATKHLRKEYDNLPPIVGLSANAFEGDKEKYIKMGMDDYLTKPVKQSDFVELIERLSNLSRWQEEKTT